MTNNAITHKLRGILACLWLLLAAIALLPYQASPTQAKPALQEEPKYNIVLLIDESGSMWCERCNDTEAPNLDVVPKDDWLPLYETPPMRLKAVEGLMANMAVEPKVTNFNVGIVAFHSKATTVTPLQQVGDADNLRNMIKALYQNHESVFKEWKDSAARGQPLTTNTAEAIQQAYDMLFEPSGAPKIKEGKNVVLMISDGVPEVRGSSKSAEHSKTAQLVQKLTGNKAQFISLLIFNPSARPEAQVKDEDRNFWADLAKGPGAVQACDYWEVSDSKLLFQSTQNILRCILTGNTTQPPVFTLTEGTPKQFAVESYIKEVSVTIKKNNPRTVVEVLRPNGNPLPKMPSGTDAGDTISYRSVGSSESYRIAHPSGTTNSWVGCWTVTVKAAEEADKRVPVEFVPVAYAADYSLKFNRPEASVWQVGKPLPVEVELLDNNGQGINPTALGVNDPLSLLVRRPDDTSGSQPLPLQGASYTGQYKADVEGSYVFTATINAANLLKSSNLGCQSILQSQPGQIAAGRRIEMKLQPWLDLQSPKQGEQVRSDQFKAQAQVMMGNQGAQNDSLVQGEVKAEIINRNDGKVLTRFVLQRDKSQNGLYSRQPTNLPESGDYTLVVSFNGQIAGGAAVLTDTARVDFNLVKVVPTATPIPPSSTPVPPTATEPPTPVPVPPSPTATATPDPTLVQGSSEFPWWLLAVLGLLGLGAVGFFLWRGATSGARLDGLRLEPSEAMGSALLLRNKQHTIRLGSATLQFTATNPTGLPSMKVVGAAEPVKVNGTDYSTGQGATLNSGDNLTVGGRSYRLDGMPRARRGSRTVGTSYDYTSSVSSDDYSGTY